LVEQLSNPYTLFVYALNSPVTRERYATRLNWFYSKIGMAEGPIEERCKAFVEKANESNEWAWNSVVRFVMLYRERYDKKEITASTIRNYIKAIKLFCEMNDIMLPWKKVTRGLPKGRKWADDRAPSIEEIRTLCEYPDRRMKAIVYTMCSSGIRLGAWDYLRWEHVTPIERDGQVVAAKIVVYPGEEEQYFSYCSPEAYLELKSWMDYRQSFGEGITPKSWIIRDLWATLDPRINGSVARPMRKKSSGIKRLIDNAWQAQGIRKPLTDGKKRHEFQSVHGFRKFYKSRCEMSGMKPAVIEVTMGHSIGVSDSYFRPLESELLEEYLKAVPLLAISEAQQVRQELAQKQQTYQLEMHDLKSLVTNLQSQVSFLSSSVLSAKVQALQGQGQSQVRT
jgi:hypothetical protein